MSKATVVRLLGGLGNQLFCYAAGKYLEEVAGHRVLFDTSKIGRGFTDHGASLEGRGLEGPFINGLPSTRRNQIFGNRLPARGRKTFTTSEVGYDARLRSVRPGSLVIGYFQSWKYVNAISAPQIDRELLVGEFAKSQWFVDTLAIIGEEKPIGVHVRRGDYRQLNKDLGLMGVDYFTNAVRELDPDGSRNFRIFSDEPDAAEALLGPLIPGSQVVRPPQGSDPAESLVLFSHTEDKVLSNSTFSWWGAWLGQGGGRVVAPSPWFRGQDDPKDLIPPQWESVFHQWGASD